MKEPIIIYTTQRTKPLSELRASDVPRGLDAADLATDFAEKPTEVQHTSAEPELGRSSP